jgi:transposase
METLGKLRRRHLVKGESLSAIARDTQLSRNTVRKYVAMESGELRYVRKHQPFPQLGQYRSAHLLDRQNSVSMFASYWIK